MSVPTISLPTGAGVNTPASLSAVINSALSGTAEYAISQIPAIPVTSVAGSTGAVTSTELATALAGSGLEVSGGQLVATGGGGGSSTITTSVIATGGASQTLAFGSNAFSAYDLTLSANCALTLSGGVSGELQSMTLRVQQPSGGGYIPTFTTPVEWPYGTSPTPNSVAGRFDIYQFTTFGDGIYAGAIVGLGIQSPAITVTIPSGSINPGATVTPTGSYTGSAPTNIDYSFDDATWTTANPAATIANNGYSFSFTASETLGNYVLYVRETNANGIHTSAAFTVSASAPGAPTVSSASGVNAVTLTITAPSNTGGSAITGYNILRSTTTGTETQYDTSSSLTYVDGGGTDGTTYYYTTEAVNAIGPSAQSNEVTGTPVSSITVPAAPTLGTPTVGSGQISIPFTDGSTGGAAISSHNVYRSTTSGSETELENITTASPFVDSTVTNGTEYFYKMTALNTAGESTKSNEVNGTPTAATHSLNVNGGSASTPTTSSLVAGDNLLDVQIYLLPSSWTPSNTSFLISKWSASNTAAQEEWVLALQSSGKLLFEGRNSSDGVILTTSNLAVGTAGVAMWIRVVCNPTAATVDGFAAGTTALMTSPDGSTWTTLANASGAQNTTAGLQVPTTPQPLSISGNGSNLMWSGNVYRTIVAIAGTVVNDIDFTNQTTGATTLTASTGANWTVTSPATEL